MELLKELRRWESENASWIGDEQHQPGGEVGNGNSFIPKAQAGDISAPPEWRRQRFGFVNENVGYVHALTTSAFANLTPTNDAVASGSRPASCFELQLALV